MHKIITAVILGFLMCSYAHAEPWVCQDGQTLVRYWGDGYKKGICGLNNSNIIPQCILATEQEYADAGLSYKKIDKTVVTGNRIVDWTQQEIDDYLQAQADAQAQAEQDRLVALDDSIADTDMTGIKLQRVETTIDNIGSLTDAKVFLKKLCRYIIDLRID